MHSEIKNILLWIGVLPGAILGGFLMTFPLHWILYSTLVSGSVISGVNIESIERFLSPFIIALGFVLIGTRIAPSNKIETATVLTITYLLLFMSVFIFMSERTVFELRSVGALIGSCLGLFVAWKTYSANQSI